MTEPKTMLEWAQFYSEEWGCSVVPLRKGKVPAVQWAQFQRRRPNLNELEKWFGGDKPAWGMALVCGEVSGNLVRLDFDDPKDYGKLSHFLMARPTFRSQREGGGYGVLLKSRAAVPKLPGGTFKDHPKLEVMGEGCITVVPPTPGYEWLNDARPELTDFVSWLRDALAYDLKDKPKEGADGGEPDDELAGLLEDTGEGGRDDALTRITNILRSRGLRLGAIKKTVRPHFDEWPGAGTTMTWEEAEAVIEKVYGQYAHQGTRYGGDGGQAAGLHLPGSTIERESFERTAFDPAVGRERPKAEPYLVDGLVMGGDQANVAMAAFTGLGKTTLCLAVAVCMARGVPVWGLLDVPRPLRVMFVDQEEVLDQIEETLGRMAEAYGRAEPGNMLVLSGKGRPYSVLDPETMDSLYADIESFRPDFLFVDGWQWFVGGKVSDKEVVNPALGWLRAIRSRFGCGTWIIHHTKKAGAPQNRPLDSLELASGAQELMNQARTKLIYEHMRGEYEDFGFLHGRTGRATWNPVRLVLEYDQTTQSHRLVGREEASELFDQETLAEYFGELAKSRLIKGVLNRLGRLGWSDRKVADFLGLANSSVVRWRAGTQRPTKDRLEALEALLVELERKSGNKKHRSGIGKASLAPREHEKMPKTGVPYRKNIDKHRSPVSSVTGGDEIANAIKRPAGGSKDKRQKEARQEGKPGPLCGKCPLKGQPYVGGRGGSSGCVMLVGDAPGQSDAKSGKAYAGRVGLRLEKALRTGPKIDPNLCRYTNAVACHVPKSRDPTKKALECCRSLLEAELAEYRPKTVITLGAVAFKAFYPGSLQSYHGLRIGGDRYTLVPMYKPDAFDKSPDLLRTFVADFAGFKARPKMRVLEGDYRRAEEFKPASERVAVDTETTGLALTSEIVGIGLCDNPGEAVFMSKEAGLASLRANPPDRAVMHNAKYDLGIFESNGLPMSVFDGVDDSLLLAYVMEKRPLGLKDLALQELNLEMSRFMDVLGGKATFADVPEAKQVAYGCADPDGTLRLWNALWKEASTRERKVYTTLERPLAPILARMELDGVWVDLPYLEKLGKEVDAEMDEVAALLEGEFDLPREALTRPKQMQEFVYKKLGLPISALTDPDNPSTGRRILERIRHEHKAVDLILRYRELSSLKNTFVTGIIERARGEKIFPRFNQAVVVTGRLSSSDPNFQGIPSRRTSEFRKAIVAPPGFRVVALDNSQIDLRSLAHISGCPVLNEIFDNDGDIHAETSMLIYGDVEGTHRFEAKAANFMPVFGGTYIGLARRTGLSEEEAQSFLDKWYEHYHGVAAWLKRLRKQAMEDGYVDTIYGRRRHIPGLFTHKREHALRQAQNTPNQGTSADVLKLQMIDAAEVLTPFAQIHDELDFYVPEKGLDETVAEIKRRMEGVDCPFRLKVDVKVGPNLGEMEKWEPRSG